MTSIFALVDCNNFFVSCERAFAPKLENKAVVVLSSNDGCAIARSNEAKALGITMGMPFYQFRSLHEEKKVEILSSNFQLYADMSHRVMEAIKIFCPFMEIYSVDEAFLDLRQAGVTNYTEFAKEVKSKIQQWTGIPVSVGIAPTKTLAKLASHIAKNSSGICELLDKPKLDEILKNTEVEELWGIRRKTSIKLRMFGIGNAQQLKNADPAFIRKNFSVTGERVVHELNGVSCIELKSSENNKSIIASRSFGRDVMAIEELEEALSSYISNACVKLREQGSRASSINVFLATNSFNLSRKQYKCEKHYVLPYPSGDSSEIIHYAKKCLHEIYQAGYHYHKVGIALLDLKPCGNEQIQLFKKHDYLHSDKLMQAMDKINKNMGKNSVFLAAQGVEQSWKKLSQNKSPEYTTSWNELPKVR